MLGIYYLTITTDLFLFLISFCYSTFFHSVTFCANSNRSFGGDIHPALGLDNPWLNLMDHMKMFDRYLLYWGLMVGSTVLPAMVDHPGLVHMNFRGTSALRRIPNSASLGWIRSITCPADGVVVQREIVFASIECSRCREYGVFALVCHKHSVMGQHIRGGCEPGGTGWLPWLVSALGLVTFPLWLGDNLLCNLDPAERKWVMSWIKFNQRNYSNMLYVKTKFCKVMFWTQRVMMFSKPFVWWGSLEKKTVLRYLRTLTVHEPILTNLRSVSVNFVLRMVKV